MSIPDYREHAWAKMSGPGSPFEVVHEDVRGTVLPVFKHRHSSLRDMLLASSRHGDLGYFTLNGETLTFADNLQRVPSVARALAERYGIGKGDRVAIFSANRPEYAVMFWATVSLGAIVTAYNGWWTTDEVVYATELTEPKLIVGDRKRLARLDGVAGPAAHVPTAVFESEFDALVSYAPGAAVPDGPIAEDDPVVILFTSGTTGRAKGATITNRGLVGFVQVNQCGGAVKTLAAQLAGGPAPALPGSAGAGGSVEQPVTLLTSPMFHVSGMFAGIIMGLALGIRHVLREGRFDEEDALRLIESERVHSWSPVGGLGMRVINHPSFGRYDTSSLRNVSFGGGPTSPAMRAEIKQAFPSIGINMSNGYGSSETVAAVSSNSGAEYEALPDSAGRVNPTIDIQIWDEMGRQVPDGVEGAVMARSAYNMLGYWQNPGATAEVLKPGLWLDIGDVGRIVGGMLTINSRARDMIIRGGENVYPIEVERRLDEHPLIAESAVVGADHPVLGQEVKAIVVPLAGVALDSIDLDEVATFTAAKLAVYKVPTMWEIRQQPLPRNASGKVLKTVLLGVTEAPTEE